LTFEITISFNPTNELKRTGEIIEDACNEEMAMNMAHMARSIFEDIIPFFTLEKIGSF
jgi:hypothetical protein